MSGELNGNFVQAELIKAFITQMPGARRPTCDLGGGNFKYIMRKFLLALLCLPCVVLLASCLNAYDPSAKFTPDRLREDFEVLRRSLEEGHPGLYRHANKSELDRLFSEAERSLDRPLDVNEFYRVLAPLVAAVRCGHTNVSLPDVVKEQYATSVPSLPLLIKIIDGRMFVWRDLRDRSGRLAGKEILSINEVQAARIVPAMLAAAGGDGNIQTSRIKRMEGWNFIERLAPLTGVRGPFVLTVLEPGASHPEQISLDGIDTPALRRNWEAWFPRDRRPARAGEIEFIDDGHIARMAVREFGGFADDEQKRGLGEFFQDSFRQMAAKGTKVLILDLRSNDGGDDRLGTLLLSYLLDRPFQHYKDIVANDISFALGKGLFGTTRIRLPYKTEKRGDGIHHITDYPNLGLLQPSSPTFSGKIYVLMDGGSFSTTAEVISQLHSHRRAEFIGQEAGGAYDGNNSGTIAHVILPNTRLNLHLPLMSYHLAVQRGADYSRGVLPDHPVAYSIGDYLVDADKELALALELARREPTAPESRGQQ